MVLPPAARCSTQLGAADAEAQEEGEDVAPEAGETHQTAWIDAEQWWRSNGSALAGDRIGLLLDCDRGELIAVKNGQELGVVFNNLVGSFCFAVLLPHGAHVHVTAAINQNLETFPRVEQRPNANRPTGRGLIMERVVGSVLQKLGSPTTLNAIICGRPSQSGAAGMHSAEQEIDVVPVFGATLNLLGKIVEGWADEVPPSESESTGARAGPREVKNAWSWGRAHSSFTISDDRLSATRHGGPHDYAAVTGNAVMDRGVHEWTLKIERDVDGTWVGVSSPDLTLGRDTTPQSIDPSNSKVWWWKSAGFTWQNHPHSDRPRNADQAFRRGRSFAI